MSLLYEIIAMFLLFMLIFCSNVAVMQILKKNVTDYIDLI